MGRFAPLHSGLGFRLIGNGSLLLLLVRLCLGDDHTTSHLASLPQIRPVTHFAQGVTLPPHKRRRLPDGNSSDDERESSAGLLLPDEEEGDEENCRPASLALLLDYIMSKFPVAPKPLAQPSTRRFHVFGAASFVQESSQRSSNISWFDHVQFACASTQSKFEPRFYEGKSLSTIMPSVSKVMKVSHSPCQEWDSKSSPNDTT